MVSSQYVCVRTGSRGRVWGKGNQRIKEWSKKHCDAKDYICTVALKCGPGQINIVRTI